MAKDVSRRVRYHDLFDCDIREAAAWYDERSPSLGDDFVTKTRQCVDRILEKPERFGRLPSGNHYAQIKRFPYIVLFDFNDDELLMLGVTHTARDPEKWRKRIDEA